jgi:hypothetical protein
MITDFKKLNKQTATRLGVNEPGAAVSLGSSTDDNAERLN